MHDGAKLSSWQLHISSSPPGGVNVFILKIPQDINHTNYYYHHTQQPPCYYRTNVPERGLIVQVKETNLTNLRFGCWPGAEHVLNRHSWVVLLLFMCKQIYNEHILQENVYLNLSHRSIWLNVIRSWFITNQFCVSIYRQVSNISRTLVRN